jgi:hypothetical protein
MKNQRLWLGILVMVLVFGFIFTGCDLEELEGNYTFEFKVRNAHVGVITEIQFLNGDNPGAPVLQTETVSLSRGDITGVYKISGFTKGGVPSSEVDDSHRYNYFAIRIIYEDGTRCGGVSYAKNRSKILVEVDNVFDPPMVFFRAGDW